MRTLRYLLLFYISLLAQAGFAQPNPIQIDGPHLVAGMYNYFYLVGCQEEQSLIRIEFRGIEHYADAELPADTITFEKYIRGNYRITIPTVGQLSFVFKDGEEEKVYLMYAKPMVPNIRFGGNDWKRDSMRAFVAKAQKGVYAPIEGYDVCGKCAVNGFELTRIHLNGREANRNNGGYFTEANLQIMRRLEPGDLLLFRRITYRCPGSDRVAKARDLIFTMY